MVRDLNTVLLEMIKTLRSWEGHPDEGRRSKRLMHFIEVLVRALYAARTLPEKGRLTVGAYLEQLQKGIECSLDESLMELEGALADYEQLPPE